MPENRIFSIALALSFLGFVLMSPRIGGYLLAWVAPGALLFFTRKVNSFWKATVLGISVLFLSGIIANWRIIPLETPIYFIVVGVLSILGSVPYLLDRIITKNIHQLTALLGFPVMMVSLEYLNSLGDNGVWGSIAHTQFDFLPLIQVASITGVFGVSFLIYFWASILAQVVENQLGKKPNLKALAFFTIPFTIVIIYGLFQLKNSEIEAKVKVAGVVNDPLSIVEGLYESEFEEKVNLIYKTDERVGAVLPQLTSFIENPQIEKYEPVRQAIIANNQFCIDQTQKAIGAGAKIIIWSEGAGIALKGEEEKLINELKALCVKSEVTIVGAFGLYKTEVPSEGSFIENKVIAINEKGGKTVYFKNKAFRGDPSILGDGNLVKINTASVTIAPLICYDADFPNFVRAIDAQADLLTIPASDWSEIGTIHAQMAKFRSIENGIPMVRICSNGLSLATDYKGKTLVASSSFKNKDGLFLATIPLNKKNTVYAKMGDGIVGALCIAILSILLLQYFFKQKTITL